ncbi:MAG: class I SAM-dependent methyltransferase [Xanthobacteraceae bacterium]
MGRWSRQIAPRFLDWLGTRDGLDWLDIGCGTGALAATILAQRRPSSLIAIDSSEGFVATARATISDRRAAFQVGDAQAISLQSASRDVAVSALMLNFVPDKLKALREMKRVVRDLMSGAGLVHVDCTPIEIPTVFADFADYWRPFTLGTGPAPGYCARLDPQAQQRLKNALDERLPRREDGSIPLEARAWAVKAVA